MDTTRTKFSFLEKGLEQPYERPYSANDSTSKCFKTYPERSKISVQSPPQCIMKEKGKEYQDWRGVVTKKPSKVQKQVEQKSPIIKVSEKKKRTNSQDEKLKEAVTTTTIKPERKISSGKHVVFRTQEKVKRIGPHVEIFEAFHTKKDPSCKKVIKAAIYIQKYARGWLERARFKRIKTKAARHGPSLLAVVKEYRKMMNRIQRRAGVLNPSTPLKYSELEEWMDKKKFYETMFAKREFGKDMDKNDLQAFFKDCGKVLSRKEIDRMLHVVYPGFASEVKTIKKYHALELAFTIFPPAGSKQNTVAVSKSTWVQPIVDGIDGYGYLVSGHPALKAADIRVVGELVASSMKAWKMKNLSARDSLQ
ncbi:IQ domain-containing protein M isoform X7 [Pelodiscus sinensis]|uniref:IQ domain-containing protein M isoform X7 n=1 Tax=Pelodiscus sinensis TaxID=13735 RepID=UPI000D724A62|nr:IQ domain-containing protein M isoform X7 [Pelodiscus sinensis]|eukprot:XP_025041298.1 IQ domain-containing protein M isoform X7 [Pelodiscus sinensis]